MKRSLYGLALVALFAGSVSAACPGGGCGRSVAPGPGPESFIEIPFNYSWLTPHGGFVTYPGQPGSGFATQSDYAHLSWLVPPAENAAHVREKLRAMGVPLVRPEPQFLGRNPRITDGVKLRQPLPKPKPAEMDNGQQPQD